MAQRNNLHIHLSYQGKDIGVYCVREDQFVMTMLYHAFRHPHPRLPERIHTVQLRVHHQTVNLLNTFQEEGIEHNAVVELILNNEEPEETHSTACS